MVDGLSLQTLTPLCLYARYLFKGVVCVVSCPKNTSVVARDDRTLWSTEAGARKHHQVGQTHVLDEGIHQPIARACHSTALSLQTHPTPPWLQCCPLNTMLLLWYGYEFGTYCRYKVIWLLRFVTFITLWRIYGLYCCINRGSLHTHTQMGRERGCPNGFLVTRTFVELLSSIEVVLEKRATVVKVRFSHYFPPLKDVQSERLRSENVLIWPHHTF